MLQPNKILFPILDRLLCSLDWLKLKIPNARITGVYHHTSYKRLLPKTYKKRPVAQQVLVMQAPERM